MNYGAVCVIDFTEKYKLSHCSKVNMIEVQQVHTHISVPSRNMISGKG